MRYLAIAAMVAAPALFAAQSPAWYPWDSRPLTCAPYDVQADCAVDTWPSYSKSWRHLTALYSAEKFSQLEDALDNIQQSPRRFASGRPIATAAEAAFLDMFPAGEAREGETERIARWKDAVPGSRYAPIAEAFALHRAAWRVRGTGFANSVSPESWELFSKHLKQAERMLLNAPAAAMDLPLWHHLMLDVKLNLDAPDMQAFLENAVKRWPGYYPFYEHAASRLQPKWGGSWRALDAFAGRWARSQDEGDALYARIYVSMRNAAAPTEMVLDWPRLKKGMRELVASNNDLFFKNVLASYACAMRDRPAFDDAMKALGGERLRKADWLRGNGYEACSRWGTTDT